jgi:peptidoglycan/LPS O-acetylase OafA/YrhL
VSGIERPPRERMKLDEGLSGRRNALGLIRLVLASAVIVSHAFPLSRGSEDPFSRWFQGQENLGGVAVIGFFVISGYLITKSGQRNDIIQYMWARVLRIFPAYIAVLLVGAAIVGPIIWLAEGHSLNTYLTRGAGGPLTYLTANWSLDIYQYGILDIFQTTTPYGQEVGASVLNGSLWSLTYEWFCYLVIGLLVLFGLLSRFKVIIPILTGTVFVLQIVRLSDPAGLAAIIPWLADPLRINLLFTFLIGACFAVYSNRIVVDDRLGAFSLVVAVYTLLQGGFHVVGIAALAYSLFWLAARLPNWAKRVGSRNDYSYGIYLYGFLVQQVLAFVGVIYWGLAAYIFIALVVSAGCAWLSWHILERPALGLKDRGPGRGMNYWWQKARSLGRTIL